MIGKLAYTIVTRPPKLYDETPCKDHLISLIIMTARITSYVLQFNPSVLNSQVEKLP